MSQSVLSGIIIFVLCILGVCYHEYGHMKVAKKHGLKVKTFCVGFGKPIIKRTGADGTVYGVALLPLGGYCDIPTDELNNSPLRTYVSVLLAGVIRNFLLGTVLLVIGQLIIVQGFYNPITLLSNAFGVFLELAEGLGGTLLEMLNLKQMAEYGGFVGQMSTTSNAIVSASHTMSHVIGMSFMMGGLTNYILALFNILPIPGIDGGQIVTRLLCDFSKKVFKFEISKTLVGFVNLSVVVIISGYQVLLLLMDVPFIRNFFLSM